MTAINSGVAADTTGFGVDTLVSLRGVGNEIGGGGVAEGGDGAGEFGAERAVKIPVTDCHNELRGGLADEGTADELAAWGPLAGSGDLIEGICHVGSPTLMTAAIGVCAGQFKPLQMNCRYVVESFSLGGANRYTA